MANEKRLIDVKELKRAIWHVECDVYEFCEGCVTNMGISRLTLDDVIDEVSTVDAVEVPDVREFAEEVAYQFGYYCQNSGRLHITHGGLSTLEHAFDILGWENPHPVPECECETDGCHEHATCGTLTADGYKRLCGRHYRTHAVKMDGERKDNELP